MHSLWIDSLSLPLRINSQNFDEVKSSVAMVIFHYKTSSFPGDWNMLELDVKATELFGRLDILLYMYP